MTASSRCLREPAFGRQQRLEPCDVVGRGAQLGLCGRDVRLRRFGLGARLPDLLGPCAGLQQPQLRVGLAPLGLDAANGELGVGRIERRNRRAGGDAVALVDGDVSTRPPTSGADAHFGRLDIARRAQRAVGCRPPARRAGRHRQADAASSAATR